MKAEEKKFLVFSVRGKAQVALWLSCCCGMRG